MWNVYDDDAETLFRSISEYIYQIRLKFSSHGINPIKQLEVWDTSGMIKKNSTIRGRIIRTVLELVTGTVTEYTLYFYISYFSDN